MKRSGFLALLAAAALVLPVGCSDDDDDDVVDQVSGGVVDDEEEDDSSSSDDSSTSGDSSSSDGSYSMTATYCTGYYYGNINYNAGKIYEYYVVLSEVEYSSSEAPAAGSSYYVIDFLSSTAPDDLDNIVIPEGTYTLATTEVAGTLNSENVGRVVVSSSGSEKETYFASGKATVTAVEDMNVISASFEEDDGTTHTVSYTGTPDFTNYAYYSTLTSDVTLSLTGWSCTAYYYGDQFSNGGSDWYIYLENSSATTAVTLELNSSITAYSEGLPVGTYTGEYSTKLGKYITGVIYNKATYYSWYFNMSNGYITTPYSPLGDGTITISEDSTGTYTIDIDSYDDSGNYTIKGSWTGTPTCSDETTSSLSVSSASLGEPLNGGHAIVAPLEMPLLRL